MGYEGYPRPAVTADTVVVAGRRGDRRVLLVRRGRPPFDGMWALPGGFLDEGEEPAHAAVRELAEETGVSVDASPRLVGLYGAPGRDPRGWTVSAAFLLDAGHEPPAATGGDDAADAAWHPVDALPPLAFDHARIVGDALAALDDAGLAEDGD